MHCPKVVLIFFSVRIKNGVLIRYLTTTNNAERCS